MNPLALRLGQVSSAISDQRLIGLSGLVLIRGPEPSELDSLGLLDPVAP